MSKNSALTKWFDDASKAEELQNRVSAVETEIEEKQIVTRTENENTEENEETSEVEAVEEETATETDELIIELDDESINQIASQVANILESRIAPRLDRVVARLTELEGKKEATEDTPKQQQKLRFKLQSALEDEVATEVTDNHQVSKINISELRKQRLARIKS